MLSLSQMDYQKADIPFYRQAIDSFKKILTLNPKNGHVWAAMANMYLITLDISSAYKSYQQALLLLPVCETDPNIWYGIGLLYLFNQNNHIAEQSLAKVISLDPQFTKINEVYYRLACINLNLKNYSTSIKVHLSYQVDLMLVF